MAEQSWIYESGSQRFKHKWHHDYADNTRDSKQNRIIGKCPNTLIQRIAEKLLNERFHYSPESWEEEYPKEILIFMKEFHIGRL